MVLEILFMGVEVEEVDLADVVVMEEEDKVDHQLAIIFYLVLEVVEVDMPVMAEMVLLLILVDGELYINLLEVEEVEDLVVMEEMDIRLEAEVVAGTEEEQMVVIMLVEAEDILEEAEMEMRVRIMHMPVVVAVGMEMVVMEDVVMAYMVVAVELIMDLVEMVFVLSNIILKGLYEYES